MQPIRRHSLIFFSDAMMQAGHLVLLFPGMTKMPEKHLNPCWEQGPGMTQRSHPRRSLWQVYIGDYPWRGSQQSVVAGHLVTGPMSKPSFCFLCQCHHGIAQVGDVQSSQALQTFPICVHILTATTRGQGPANHRGCLASYSISAEGLALLTAGMLRYRHT